MVVYGAILGGWHNPCNSRLVTDDAWMPGPGTRLHESAIEPSQRGQASPQFWLDRYDVLWLRCPLGSKEVGGPDNSVLGRRAA